MQSGGSGGPRISRTSQTSNTSQISGGPRRQSGAPAPGMQPPYDPNQYGLPDVTGPSPRMTPRVASSATRPSAPPAQPGQPHTLGVGERLARSRPTGSPSLPQAPARAATITQQIRAVAPPDVARQTLDEQKMLAHELIILPDALETSGLAKSHANSYIETVRAYVDLADSTWIAVAEERLEQSGAEQVYRQNAIAIGRRIQRMRDESQMAASNTQFPLPRRRPALWRRRVRLQRIGLRDWQAHLSVPANPRIMGRSLARLRGATALARASDLELLLWTSFPAIVGDVVMVLWLGLMVTLIAMVAEGAFASAGMLALAAVGTLVARVLYSLLVRRGPAELDHLFAISVFSTLRSPRASTAGSRVLAGMLRAWGVLFTSAGLLGMLAALGYSAWQLFLQAFVLPTTALGWVEFVGSVIARGTWLPALVGLAAVSVLALPLLLLSALRYIRELAGNIAWVPAARRYALGPALHVLAFLATGAVAALAAWEAFAPQDSLSQIAFTHVTVGTLTQALTLQTVALFVVPALMLLAGVDIPYRVGIARWRRHWLNELTTRRADIDADVRRRSAVDPLTGMQDSSDENLQVMQYNLTLLQFYITRTDETRRVSSAPYGLFAGIGIVLLLAVVALLVDGLAQQLAHMTLSIGF
ncbi:MAG TPA: hypothetical protein VH591_21510 [Ktedonobacterales bacterium]